MKERGQAEIKMEKALVGLTLLLFIFSPVLAQEPLVIVGVVRYNGEMIKYANITIINERTGEKLHTITDEKGRYSVVLKDLPSGWTDGDIIKAVAKKNGLKGTAFITASSQQGYQWLNITMHTPPPPSPPPSSNFPPEVERLVPAYKSSVSGNTVIEGRASDVDGNETIVRVEVRIDNGTWTNATGTTSWSYEWDTSNVKNGNHVIYARAFDGSNYSSLFYIFVEVNNEENASANVNVNDQNYVVYMAIAMVSIVIVIGVLLLSIKKIQK